jgi:cation:H+ antiporter
MGAGPALALLALSLAVTLGAARVFARRLDRLGVAFGFPEALLGLLTALAADGPEISSALIALAKGDHSVSVGVVLGASTLNLATMIGLSALLTGAVVLSRSTLAIEGAMGLVATLLAGAVLLELLDPVFGVLLLACFGVPYLLILVDGSRLLTRLPLPPSLRSSLASVAGERASAHATAADGGDGTREAAEVRPHHALWIASDLALIIAGSFGMVQAAVNLGGHWGVSGTLVGVLALGPLTSLPNALTGVRLGLARRGAALVSETFNSNTINLAGGVMVPALFVGVESSSDLGRASLAWLLGMTCVCLLCLARKQGAGRGAGAVLVALYAGFVALQLLGA